MRHKAKGSRVAVVLVTLALVLSSCSEEEKSGEVVQPLDLEQVEGLEQSFDPNNLLETDYFVDAEALDTEAIERFLQKTPYDHPSFLATYQSNGVRAADAIARAARAYRINPLAFLVFAQTTQGLIGERSYPFPPSRVEYVFQCGCFQDKKCLPELAGFDRQVDCLGRMLRVALDEIAEATQTASGWGPEIEKLTLDGKSVTPANEATAAIYERRPTVAEGKAGGSWIFWNVWNLYSFALDYFGPSGGLDFGAWIGDPCGSAKECGYENAICDTSPEYHGGLCSLACEGTCPAKEDFPEAFCAAFPEGGFCLQVCDPAEPSCREGYVCRAMTRFGGSAGDTQSVCIPLELP